MKSKLFVVPRDSSSNTCVVSDQGLPCHVTTAPRLFLSFEGFGSKQSTFARFVKPLYVADLCSDMIGATRIFVGTPHSSMHSWQSVLKNSM